MTARLILALDGHDGVGKTTLSQALAKRLGGTAVRPFSGSTGAKLLEIGAAQDVKALVALGTGAIDAAVASIPCDRPVVLDRGWMTVASFVPTSAEFFSLWKYWIPTALCWIPLDVTVERLSARTDEEPESTAWHQHYLDTYLMLAEKSDSFVLRTDLNSLPACVERLTSWASGMLPHP